MSLGSTVSATLPRPPFSAVNSYASSNDMSHTLRSLSLPTHPCISLFHSVSLQLVELMGGSISVESEFGKGATFTVRLPVNSHHPAFSATFALAPSSSASGGAGNSGGEGGTASMERRMTLSGTFLPSRVVPPACFVTCRVLVVAAMQVSRLGGREGEG